MLNKGVEACDRSCEPPFVKAVVGDHRHPIIICSMRSIMSKHRKDMLPEVVEQFKSRIGKDYVLTLRRGPFIGVKLHPALRNWHGCL